MSDLFGQMNSDALAAAARAAPTDEQLKGLRAKAVEMVEIDQRIARGEELLKELKARREEIARRELVDAMDVVGQDKIGLAEYEVDIESGDYVFASLPNPGDKDDDETRARKELLRAEGLQWLIDNGHDGLIKTLVVAEPPRGAHAAAERIAEYVRLLPAGDGTNEPAGYSARIEESVHWATLTSFVKEQLKIPEVVLPLEQLGAVVGRIAKIVKRKKGKK